MRNPVLVEVNAEGVPIRIFRTVKASLRIDQERVKTFERAEAVGAIREQVFERAGIEPWDGGIGGECDHCGAYITWGSGHMHEQLPKGKGGEVSVENGRALCYDCHLGRPDSAHGDRRWGGRKQ